MDWDTDMADDPLEQTTHLESTFYSKGYDSGFAHGRLHGLFEGRELGKEKSWELWEEVGYYEGWARMWIDLFKNRATAINIAGRKSKELRALNHAQTLVDLINTFPTVNPTSVSQSSSGQEPLSTAPSEAATPDLANLLSQIRARYRLLCSCLGVRPRLATAVIVEAKPGSGASAAVLNNRQEEMVDAIEGPMRSVDTKQLKF
ncbi:hypothetical protein L204_103051 [Cryptococcus depauperatus]|nr:hypothetical protein L204_00200 [Cryptococcus depauperatus CBS 7855]